MKTRISLITFLISLIMCTYAQTDPILTRDTLTDGSVFVTVKDVQNRIWDQYKILQVEDSEIMETTIPASKRPKDKNSITRLINTPEEQGGCLPEDIIYNSNNGKYYLYGGRRLVEYDPVFNNFPNSFDVSDYGNIMCTHTWTYMHENCMAHNSNENKVYTLTNNNDLVVLDCSSGNPVISNTYTANSSIPMMRSVEFNTHSNKLFWVETDFDVSSTIHMLNENTDQHQVLYTSQNPIYDIQTNKLGTQLYISDCSKFVVVDLVSNNVVYEYPSFGIFNPSNLIIVNNETNHVYVDQKDMTQIKEFDVNPNNIHFIGNIATQVETFMEAEYNNASNKIFYTGYKLNANDFTEHYYGVINTDNSVEIIYHEHADATGLTINNQTNRVYFGGYNIKAMNVNYTSDVITIDNGCRLSNKLVSEHTKGYVGAISHRDGIITTISPQLEMDKYATAGFFSDKGVFNPVTNETIFLSSPHLGGSLINVPRLNSSITCIDGETGQYESYEICPEARQISVDEENGNILISQGIEQKLIIYDGITKTKITEVEVNHSIGFATAFSKSNKIVVNGYYHTSIIDKDTYTVVATIDHTTGWGRNTIETEENTFYITVYEENAGKVIKINPDYTTNEISILNPITMVFNKKENCLFVNHGGDYLKKIDLINFQVSQSYFLPAEYPNKLINSLNEEKLYVMSLHNHIKILDISQNTFSTVTTSYIGNLSLLNPFNNQLYIYSHFGTDRKQHLEVLDCTKDVIIDHFSPNQYLEKKFNMVMISGHQQGIVLNPVTNKLYIANQGYSNITEVECDPEVLTLKPGYTWFSLPRLDRTDNNGVPIDPVFQNPENISPSYLTINHNSYWRTYFNNNVNGTLSTLYSTDGYKANNQTLTTGFIYLNGTILDPETEIQLTDQHENWIGYFLTKPLPIEEAFGDVFDKVSIIKTQHWTITRPNPNDPPIETTGIQGGVLEYGDMVAVTMFEPATLVWNDQATSTSIPILAAPQSFSFEEEADYTPVAIILDPQDNPDEIAVYSNNICQGASVVYGDTVMVQAYLDNLSKGDDTLEIVRYYGQSKTINKTTKYAVLNLRTGFMEPRVARERDEQPFYVISLEKQAAAGIENNEIMKFSIYPNPTKGDIHIEGFASQGNTISCTLSRPDGSFSMEIYKNAIASGSFRTTIHPDVTPGLYLVTLTDGTHTKTEKIVIL